MDYTLYNAEELAADESFICYYLGTDDKAVAFWENWLRHHPEKIEEVLLAESMLKRLSLQVSRQEQEEAAELLRQYIQPKTVHLQKKEKSFIMQRTVIAAGGLLIMGVLLFLFSKKQETPWQVYNNPPGQRMTFTLEDNTVITLQAGSKLYRRVTEGNSEIKLEGEAFFDVKANAHRPFTVYADSLQITVLGTRFNVQHITGNRQTLVALESGKVKVSIPASGRTKILQPGEEAVYDIDEGAFNVNKFDSETVLAWRNGVLRFKDADFETIAETVQRIYGITLINRSQRGTIAYTGVFRDAGYLSLIKSICYTTGLSYTISRDTIVLH